MSSAARSRRRRASKPGRVLRAEIARKVAQITFCFHRDENTPKLVPESKDDFFPFARVPFTNGRERYLLMFDNGDFVTLIPRSKP
jgi:hypothetical protein